MSCASTFSHSLIPRYTMVTAQFEQFERHQQTGARTDKEPHAPTVMSRSCSIIRAVSKEIGLEQNKDQEIQDLLIDR